MDGAGSELRCLGRERQAGLDAVVGCFDVPGGGTVFNAGCTDWTYGIEGGDADVRRVTRNVLERLSA